MFRHDSPRRPLCPLCAAAPPPMLLCNAVRENRLFCTPCFFAHCPFHPKPHCRPRPPKKRFCSYNVPVRVSRNFLASPFGFRLGDSPAKGARPRLRPPLYLIERPWVLWHRWRKRKHRLKYRLCKPPPLPKTGEENQCAAAQLSAAPASTTSGTERSTAGRDAFSIIGLSAATVRSTSSSGPRIIARHAPAAACGHRSLRPPARPAHGSWRA